MANEKIILSAVDQTKAAFQSVQGNISRLTGSIKGIAGPLAAAFSVGAITQFSKSLIDAADNLKDLSESTGISAQELSRFGNAAQLNGASTEEFQTAIVKFSKAIGEAASGSQAQVDAFKALGISITDASGRIKPTIDLFREVSNRFAQTSDGAAKLTIAQDLLGRAGARLIPVLNQGADALSQYEATFSDEFVNTAGQFNDELDKLSISFQRIASTVLTPFIKQVNELLNPQSVDQATKLRKEIEQMQSVMSVSVGTNFLERVFGIDLGSASAKAKIEQAQELLREINRMQAATANPPAAKKDNLVLAPEFKGGPPKQSELEQEIKAVQDVLNAIKSPLSIYTQKLRELDNLKEKMLITDEQYLDRLFQLEEELQKGYPLVERNKTGLEQYAEASKNLGQQLDDVAVGALRNMEDSLAGVLTGTMSVKDAFKNMARSIISDLIKIQIQRSITGPLADALGGMIGTKAIGGAVGAEKAYLVGERGPELFVPNKNGAIIPNDAMGGGVGGESVSINQTINVTTGVEQTVRVEIANLLPQIAEATKSAVLDAKQRGGRFAATFR